MSQEAHIQLSNDAQAILDRVKALPSRLGSAIARVHDYQNELTVGYIIKNNMSQRGPDTLGVVTGRLRRSIRPSKATISLSSGVESAIGSNVEYMGPHEFGFEGTVQVKSFARRSPHADRFLFQGVEISRVLASRFGLFTKRGQSKVPQTNVGYSQVKAHSRRMKVKARRPIWRGIMARIPAYSDAISKAIVNEFQGGAA